jgi:AsmA protein
VAQLTGSYQASGDATVLNLKFNAPALSAFSGKAASSRDTTILNASTTVRVAPDDTTLSAIDVAVPSLGVLTGSGTVSASGALNFKMVAELSSRPERIGQRSAQREGRSRDGIPFMIEGTTSDPKFVPDVGGMAGGAIQQAITGKVSPEGESSKKGLGGLLRKRF